MSHTSLSDQQHSSFLEITRRALVGKLITTLGAHLRLSAEAFLAQRIDPGTAPMGQPEFIGFAAPGSLEGEAVWSIKRMTYTGNTITEVNWQNGTNAFNAIWDDRAILSYS